MLKLLVQGLLGSVAALALCQLPVSAQVLYNLSYARSLNPAAGPKAETVVSIRNTNPFGCNIQVNWLNNVGALIGISGPVGIPPNNTLEFTTANAGEAVHPMILDVFRGGAAGFEGAADIVSNNCALTTLLGVNASLVTYYPAPFVPNDNPPAFKTISVTRPIPLGAPFGGRLGD
ncbi:hypothetical protein [Candidatus Cyanaurora vandensis]|uniref:hypothetical protein n=1 Tax=Candidatus Cyanaurora vandensis TaxID=2714958 RepID=UPI00257A8AFF|nr:hypothetical protein [Candidatus Cyanaurora vandensis]